MVCYLRLSMLIFHDVWSGIPCIMRVVLFLTQALLHEVSDGSSETVARWCYRTRAPYDMNSTISLFVVDSCYVATLGERWRC